MSVYVFEFQHLHMYVHMYVCIHICIILITNPVLAAKGNLTLFFCRIRCFQISRMASTYVSFLFFCFVFVSSISGVATAKKKK